MAIKMNKIFAAIQKKIRFLDLLARNQATDIIEWELSETENIFALLVLGSLVGLPASPSHISLSLLPYMEDDLILMLNKVDTAAAPLSDLFSNLDVG